MILLTDKQEQLLGMLKQTVLAKMSCDTDFSEFMLKNASGVSTTIKVFQEWLKSNLSNEYALWTRRAALLASHSCTEEN